MTDIKDELDEVMDEREERAYQFTPGGSFILDTDPTPQPLWGDGDQVLWADGESLVIDGPQGVGKTTLAQQLALGRAGFDVHTKLLGFPIIPGQRRVLYLAMDRPKQAARSFRRMVGEAWRAELDERRRRGNPRSGRNWIWRCSRLNPTGSPPSMWQRCCSRPTSRPRGRKRRRGDA
jgi:hypothetical protein